MSVDDIKKFNKAVMEAQELIKALKDAGSDVNKILEVAKSRGLSISTDDLEAAKQSSESLKGSESLRAVIGVVVIGVAVV